MDYLLQDNIRQGFANFPVVKIRGKVAPSFSKGVIWW